MTTLTTQASVLRTTRRLAREVDRLALDTPSHVYNPLTYAWVAHREYLERYGAQRGRVLLLGMNPGPWGMTQTGVPFGDVVMVREWFGIATRLSGPLPAQHPKNRSSAWRVIAMKAVARGSGVGPGHGSARRMHSLRASSCGITARCCLSATAAISLRSI
jgi:hypothetical protein